LYDANLHKFLLFYDFLENLFVHSCMALIFSVSLFSPIVHRVMQQPLWCDTLLPEYDSSGSGAAFDDYQIENNH